MKVPFINLQEQVKNIRSEIIDNVTETIESGKFILGDKLFAFEKNISSYIGQESLGCASGTDALLMALMASSVGSGDEVITTPFTFFSTAGAIARLGAKPVFVDIDERTYNIDPALIEEKITPNTKAIIPVHLFGQPANMIEINKIAKRNNLIVIEDACQAIGAKYDGVNVGLLGDFACFSFFPTKNLGVAGDGGLITCKKQFDFDYLKKLRVHGSSKKYFHDFVGINSRLDALNAGILDIKLKYLGRVR